MKILHVMASLQPSGMERMLLSSAEQWQRHGIRCEILSTGSDGGPLEDALRAAGYPVHHIPFRSRWPILPSLHFLRRYWQLCQQGNFNLVHIHTEEATVLFALLARLAGVPRLALTVHNSFRFTGSLRLRKIVERVLVRSMGGHFGFVSDAVAANERTRFRNYGIRINNWVDTSHFRPPTQAERDHARGTLCISPSTTVILTIGNCNAAKNHGDLLKALSLVDEQRKFLYLHVGLEQPGKPEQAQAAALGLSSRVRFAGHQHDVLPWLWAADIFAMPSKYEGLAIAPLEAIAAGCPALLAAVDGLAELGSSVRYATFVPPNPVAFAEALTHLLSEPAEVRRERAFADSAVVCAQFSPQAGIDTLSRSLYQIEC